MTGPAAGIGIGMDASRDGNGSAAPLLILTDIATVSIGKPRSLEYSRILNETRGRGIAAARVFVSEPKLSALRQFVPVTVRRR